MTWVCISVRVLKDSDSDSDIVYSVKGNIEFGSGSKSKPTNVLGDVKTRPAGYYSNQVDIGLTSHSTF